MKRIPLDDQSPERVHRSAAVICGDLIYIDGIQARDVSKGTGDQTADVLQQLEDLLVQAGSHKDRLIRVEVTLRSMSDFSKMNTRWNEFVNFEKPPGRACLSGKLFPADACVQMSAVALIDTASLRRF